MFTYETYDSDYCVGIKRDGKLLVVVGSAAGPPGPPSYFEVHAEVDGDFEDPEEVISVNGHGDGSVATAWEWALYRAHIIAMQKWCAGMD